MLLFAGFFLLLRFSLSLPLTSSHSFSPSIHDSSPVLAFDDQVRQRHLYADSKHHSLFVEILSNGTVSATQSQTPYTVLELKAVKPGYTAIRGVMSSLYLCVNAAGHLFALVSHMTKLTQLVRKNLTAILRVTFVVLELILLILLLTPDDITQEKCTLFQGHISEICLDKLHPRLVNSQGVFLDAECSFSEMLQPDGYTHFLSAQHRLPVFLSFNGPGKHTLTFSQFLPLRTHHLFIENLGYEEPSSLLKATDFDSDDPLGLTNTHQDLRSPLFHIDQ
ncbi:uncharacterized protein LOC128611867 [Ictalurus furcatus]|uniref:uncharacterized protein LOC128611867 n=1 Tax=Ictalurus furcatus TaxID=66913 RepID=UPI002350AECD|nr:uncharacterized protein LOC128611867 [Ictalurus furcatus]